MLKKRTAPDLNFHGYSQRHTSEWFPPPFVVCRWKHWFDFGTLCKECSGGLVFINGPLNMMGRVNWWWLAALFFFFLGVGPTFEPRTGCDFETTCTTLHIEAQNAPFLSHKYLCLTKFSLVFPVSHKLTNNQLPVTNTLETPQCLRGLKIINPPCAKCNRPC